MNRQRLISFSVVAMFAIVVLSIASSAQPVTGGGGLTRVTTTGGAFEGSGTLTNPLKMRTDCATGSGVAWNGTSWACSALGGGAAVLSPAAITGTVNDWAPTGYNSSTTVIRVDTSGTVSITGITGGTAGRVLDLQFIGANNVTLSNQSGSTAANQIITGYGVNLTFQQSQSARLVYDATTSRWRVSSFTGVTMGNVSPTNNFFPKFSSTTGTLTNSSMFDNGTTVSVSNIFGTTGNTNIGDASADTLTVAATSTFNAATTHTAPITVQDFRGTVISPSAVTGTLNDWNPGTLSTATTVVISTSGTVTLTGLQGGATGRRIRLYNDGANNVDISHNSASSAAANRIILSTPTSSKTLRGNSGCAIELEYRSSLWYETGFNCTQLTLLALSTTDAVSVGGAFTYGFNRGNGILPTGLTGTINDWAPANLSTARIIQATASATATITGLSGGDSGRMLMLCNVGTSPIVLVNENAGSTAANRFRLPAASSVTIPPTNYWASNGYECVDLVYDGTLTRWAIATDGRSTRTQFETTTQMYNAGVMTTIGNATFGSNIVAGNDADDLTTFSNGPRGINSYAGKHIEYTDEWMEAASSMVTIPSPMTLGTHQVLVYSGTGAGLASKTPADDRPGIVSLLNGVGTAGASYTALLSDLAGFKISAAGTVATWEATVRWPTLSSSSNAVAAMYLTQMGWLASVNVVDAYGCFFAYDKGNVMTGNKNPSNVDALSCWCASPSGGRTGYLINATGNSDNSFPLGTGTVAANTWYRLGIVTTAGSKAEFYRNGVKVCEIASTNMPSSAEAVGDGFVQASRATTGTGSRAFEIDQSRIDITINAARTP